eukprot:99919-Hanusia_phi.AAC.2
MPSVLFLQALMKLLPQGPFTGGSINPARTIGAAFAFWDADNIIIYLLATLGTFYNSFFLDMQAPQPEERDNEPNEFWDAKAREMTSSKATKSMY